VSKESAVMGGLLAFGVGILVGAAINDNDDYYPHYGPGAVYYGPRPFYPPAYVYRPVYGPAFRPAVGYASPAGYGNRYNSPTNVVINNNNYYNRFSNQNNIKANQTRNAGAATRQAGAGNRSGGAANQGQNWKGQSTYAGARPGGATDRPSASNRATPSQRNQPSANQRSTGSSQTQSRARPNEAATANTRDRGYGNAKPAPARDAGTTSRTQAAPAKPREQTPQRDNALSGASQQNTGSFDRAASARGHASSGSSASASASASRPARGGRKP
jgi:hypothetical protein